MRGLTFSACVLAVLILVPSESLGGESKSRKRAKRDSPTDEQMMMYVDEINDIRRMMNASDMHEVMWDDDIADAAHDWAMLCSMDVPSDLGDYGYSLAEGGADLAIEDAIDMWHMEMMNYTYDSNSCDEGASCNNYLQMVWSTVTHIGCAHYECSDDYFYVCLYMPMMEDGVAPYSMDGDMCSACDEDAGYTECNNWLCASPMVSSTTMMMTANMTNEVTSNTTVAGNTTTASATTSVNQAGTTTRRTTKRTTKKASGTTKEGPDALDSGVGMINPTPLLALASLTAALLLLF